MFSFRKKSSVDDDKAAPSSQPSTSEMASLSAMMTQSRNDDESDTAAQDGKSTRDSKHSTKKTPKTKYQMSAGKKWPTGDWEAMVRKGGPRLHHRKPIFPVDKIHQMINDARSTEFDASVPIFLGAVEEYIATEILELSGNLAVARGSVDIVEHDLVAAIYSDNDLRATLQDCVEY